MSRVVAVAMSGRVSALCFSPNGDFLAAATPTSVALFNATGGRTVVWDGAKEAGKLFEDRPPLRHVLAFSDDGKQLFFCGARGLMVWGWPGGVAFEGSPVRLWTAPDVYNIAVVGGEGVVCAAKRGSTHFVQERGALDGKVVWEKPNGLLPITSLRSRGASVRCVVGNPSGSQCFWSDYKLADGSRTTPVDLGAISGFSVAQSPDGTALSVVKGEMHLVTFETGETKAAIAPYHVPYYYWDTYRYEWPYYIYRWPYTSQVDSGWTTLFSPDGHTVVTLGKEAVFYTRGSGTIAARIYYSDDPFPWPTTLQAEADGVGCFSPDGSRFALVRQERVAYPLIPNSGPGPDTIARRPQGDSAIEVYAVGEM